MSSETAPVPAEKESAAKCFVCEAPDPRIPIGDGEEVCSPDCFERAVAEGIVTASPA